MALVTKTAAALKPISGNKPRLQSSSTDKPTAAPVQTHGKENVVVPACVSKRKADEQAVVPPRAAKRKAAEKDVAPLRPTKRKLDNNKQAVVPLTPPNGKPEKAVDSPPRPIKRTDDKKPLTYQERLVQAGRSWALLEAAAAKKDWHQVIKLGGSVSGMSGGGLVVGEKYKVRKSYNYIMKHKLKKWRY
ncbi:hypothetical protein FPQ18DRAFT_393552 [Pyronema domesticum]|nr:hypothetical protein FPQ18DRAFT_393552 [Pyronema domesticum]